MHKYLLLLPFLFYSLLLFGFNSNDSICENSFPNVRLTVTPTPVKKVEPAKVILDKEEICTPCLPPEDRPAPGSTCDSNMTILVSAGQLENNQLEYEYTVSGGRIIGEGAKVTWDMNGGVQPGTYEIKINTVDKSNGQSWTETKVITVSQQRCSHCSFCPALTVDGPKSPTKSGDTMIFTANVNSGGGEIEITYKWKVSGGEIIEGQGTPVIKVATNSKMAGKTVKATVEIEGVCEVCPKTESAEGLIINAKRIKK